MSRIPTATSRIPTKSSAGGSLTSTRPSGLVPPVRRFPNIESTEVNESNTFSSTSSSIREFANNTTISASSSSTSGLRKLSDQSRLLTSTHRGGPSSTLGSSSDKFQIDTTLTRTSALTSTRRPVSSGLPSALGSTRPSSAMDSDNSSTNSAGSAGSNGLPTSYRSSGLQRTVRVGTETTSQRPSMSALASSVSSAVQAAQSVAESARLVSTRTAPQSLRAPISSSSSSAKSTSSADASALNKIPGVSREKISIVGGKRIGGFATQQTTAAESAPSEKNLRSSASLVPPTAMSSQRPEPSDSSKSVKEVKKTSYTEEELDQLFIPAFLQVVNPETSGEKQFIPSKDMSRIDLQNMLLSMVAPFVAGRTETIFNPEFDSAMAEADFVTPRLTALSVCRAFHSLDFLDNLSAVHDMLFEGKTLSDADFDVDLKKFMNEDA